MLTSHAFAQATTDSVSPTDSFQEAPAQVLIVVGPGGDAKYDERFAQWAAAWSRLAEEAGMSPLLLEAAEDQRQQIEAAIASAPSSHTSPHWLIVIAHGSFDQRQAQINLQGPDLTPDQLKRIFDDRDDPWVIIQGAASSGPFLQALQGENRVIITATRGPNESSATRWHGHLLEAVGAGRQEADLDLDEQVSLWEAFVWASRSVEAEFGAERLIVTEHALLDDNADGVGMTQEQLVQLRKERQAAVLAGQSTEAIASEGLLASRIVILPSPWEKARTPQWRLQRDAIEAELIARQRETQDSSDPQLLEILDRLGAHYALADESPEANAEEQSDR